MTVTHSLYLSPPDLSLKIQISSLQSPNTLKRFKNLEITFTITIAAESKYKQFLRFFYKN